MDVPTPERALLEQVLDLHRGEIAALLDGLDDEQARARLVPSLTTVLGLVKHATFVEGVWFHSRVGGVSRRELGLPRTVDESFTLTPEDGVASIRAGFEAACDRSREVAAQHPDLDEEFTWHDNPVSLRFVYLHMIGELARHAGHGDILKEQLAAR
ncbi:DinB family protein [Nocardioides nanhaiensis]|uniref:DinB family protein n=1 Tax=Nocardioides nanhaiensis TaxID=1476871 RepID=A0ABP8X3I8_9ACTN